MDDSMSASAIEASIHAPLGSLDCGLANNKVMALVGHKRLQTTDLLICSDFVTH